MLFLPNFEGKEVRQIILNGILHGNQFGKPDVGWEFNRCNFDIVFTDGSILRVFNTRYNLEVELVKDGN
jgi:hypothetical protein